MRIINEGEHHRFMDSTVMPYLQSIMREGSFAGFDGNSLKWYSFASPDPSRTVVILHGFTESARKMSEMIWYFVNSGSNVYVFDQRGHGNSYRHVDDLTLTHVERFEDYISDFEIFVDTVVEKNLPLMLYAHSMGGAVAALYLEKHPSVFKKAVLTSPMIAPSRKGVPLAMARLLCRTFILMGKSKERIFLSGEYSGDEPFEASCTSSRERYSYYEAYRRVTKTHQNCSPSYRWTLESLNVTRKILKKGLPEGVETSVLMCCAELDDVVLLEPQRQLAKRLPSCEYKLYHAKHELYNSNDEVMQPYVDDVIGFLN